MIENVQVVQAFTCVCNCCQKRWTAYGKLPTWCPNRACRSRLWDHGGKYRSHAHEIKMPAPQAGAGPRLLSCQTGTKSFSRSPAKRGRVSLRMAGLAISGSLTCCPRSPGQASFFILHLSIPPYMAAILTDVLVVLVCSIRRLPRSAHHFVAATVPTRLRVSLNVGVAHRRHVCHALPSCIRFLPSR
jgi:hypothetical protein